MSLRDHLAFVRRHVAQITARWRHGPQVDVVPMAHDVPMLGVPPNARGVYWRARVWLVGAQPAHTVASTLAHEAVGHYGLRALLRGKWQRFMEGVHRGARQDRGLKRLAKQIRKTYADRRGRCELSGLQLADEICAHVAGRHADPFSGHFQPRTRARERWAKLRQQLHRPGAGLKLGYQHLVAALQEAGRRMTATCRRAGQVMGRVREKSRLRAPRWRRAR